MRILELSGTPRQMGEAFGAASRKEIAELYRRRVEIAIAQALRYGGQRVDEGDLLAVAEAALPATRAFDADGYGELVGIAAAAQLPLVKILAMNALTDFRDVLSWPGNPAARAADTGGCTAIAVQRDRGGGEVVCGQTWDLATDNLPFVIGVVRKPDGRPVTRTLTTDGCLSLIGLNDRGIAVGTTNIRTTDARPGVGYLSIIHKALGAETFEEAVTTVVTAPRAGAHFYYVADGERVALLECSALHAHRQDLERGAAAHANHCLVAANQAIEGVVPSPSSLARQARMEALAAEAEVLTPDVVASFFADGANGKDAICRDDFDGINTNGAVIMAPGRGYIRIVHGLPSRGAWLDLSAGAA